LDRLEAPVNEMEIADQLSDRLERRYQMYGELYRRADRPRALAQVNNLRGAVGRYLLLQRVDEHHSHAELIKHLRARDVEAATKWLVTHLEKVSKKLQAMVARDEKTSA
jgi:DNA-binding GntR family transcriptional regulator